MPTPDASQPDSGEISASIAFIGGGNMARSLIGGLIANGTLPSRIHVAEPVPALREGLSADFGVQVYADAASAAQSAGTWVLAVKPQVMPEVCASLADAASSLQPLVISIAAGITTTQIARWLRAETPIVRTMPNTPALLGAGITGLFATPAVAPEQRDRAAALLSAAGETVWLEDESLMDAVTAVSGSGPAYVFLLAEAMQAAGEAEGLPAEVARRLSIQTLLGASRMLTESGEPAAELRRRVTSPNGTTQAAIESFEAGGFRSLVAAAIHAARVRGAELSAGNES